MKKNLISVLAVLVLFISLFSVIGVFAQEENATRKEAYDAISNAKEDMAIMEKEGFGVAKVNDLIIEVSSLYEAQVALEEKMGSADFSNIVKKANEAGTMKTTAYEINDELKALESQLNELSKEQDMKEAINIFNRAKKEFADERYDRAKEVINECYSKIIELQATFTKVRAIYEASTKSIAGFFVTNYIILTILAILLIAGYFMFGKKIRRYFINKSVRKLELEKETLSDLVRRSQDEYFTKKTLAESTYRIRITKFAELIRDINRRLPLLKVKLEKLEERKDRKVGKEDVEKIVSREVEGIKEERKQKERKEGIIFKIAHSLGMAKTAEEKKDIARRKKVIEEKKKEESKKQIKPAKEEKAKPIKEEEKKVAKKKPHTSFWVSIGFARTPRQKAAAERKKKAIEEEKRKKESERKRKIEADKARKEEEQKREESKKRAVELVKKRAEEDKRRKEQETKQKAESEKKKIEEQKAVKKKPHTSFWVSIGFARTPGQKAKIKAEKDRKKKEEEIRTKRIEDEKKRKIENEERKKLDEIKRKELEKQKAESERKRKIEDAKRQEIQRKQAIENAKKRKIEDEKKKKFGEIKRIELEKAKAKEAKERQKMFIRKRKEEEKAMAKERRKKAWFNFWHSLGLKKSAEEKARIKAEKERRKKEKELQKKIREQIRLAKKAKKQELTQ